MDRDVYIIVNRDEFSVGKVGDILGTKSKSRLHSIIKDIVDDLVFNDESSDYVVCSIEVR
jgi:hypothetical protein